ncbi:ClpP/crotonase-like domain-containing protein [Hyaloraphidium curvatum]|nr:ClpP/crotonase-like domain-containing protein [Hyaloraphidium curvatum]
MLSSNESAPPSNSLPISFSSLPQRHVRLSLPAPHVLLVRIDRPEAANALDRATQEELGGVWEAFKEDDEVWVAVLTGTGKAFCAGLDLKELSKSGPEDLRANGFGGLTFRSDLNKPIIAAVNGAAFGGGFELALACDIVLASEDAKFSAREVKVGLAALGGACQVLPKIIGYHTAMHLLLTGRTSFADEAKALGIVQEVVGREDLERRAVELASEIASNSPDSVRATKAVARLGMEKGWQETNRLFRTLPEVHAMVRGPNVAEGAAAFLGKRKPEWKGLKPLGAGSEGRKPE